MTTELYEQIIQLEAQAKAIKAQLEPLRAQLQAAMLQDGLKQDEHEGYVFTLKSAPLSNAWLKRQGYLPEDIPSEYVSEKVVPDVNWAGVKEWLGNPEPEYNLTITRKKVS